RFSCDRDGHAACLAQQQDDKLFFFFQAEDGIRDRTVTGVQTCALPISNAPRNTPDPISTPAHSSICTAAGITGETIQIATARRRSEERRVGKECRARWAA